jgi:putative flippase GtrA
LLVKPAERVTLQVPRALVASVLAAGLDFGLLVLLVEIGHWHPLFAATVAYLFGGVLQYVLCSVWVFPAAPQSVSFGFFAFTVLSLVGLAITWAVMAGLYDGLHVNYLVAKVIAFMLAFAWNFLSRKYLLFRPASTTP